MSEAASNLASAITLTRSNDGSTPSTEDEEKLNAPRKALSLKSYRISL